MRFRNDTTETVRFAGLAIPPNRIGTVADAAVALAIQRDTAGTMRAMQKLTRLPDDTDEDKLDRVVAFVLDEPGVTVAELVTREGKPTCAYCGRVLGRTVTSRERDAAWRRVRTDRAAEALVHAERA